MCIPIFFMLDNKRKMDDTETQGIRSKRPAQKCSDLIVMGLPWETSVSELKQYFSQFGDLVLAQVSLVISSKLVNFIRMLLL